MQTIHLASLQHILEPGNSHSLLQNGKDENSLVYCAIMIDTFIYDKIMRKIMRLFHGWDLLKAVGVLKPEFLLGSGMYKSSQLSTEHITEITCFTEQKCIIFVTGL